MPDFARAFEEIHRIDEFSNEYWSAKELATLLGYKTGFKGLNTAIRKAKLVFNSLKGVPLKNHFISVEKERKGKIIVTDLRLSRLASMLVIMNGDSHKPMVAFAKSYFAKAAIESEQARKVSYKELNISQEYGIYSPNWGRIN
ncbi:MAG: hypothetical protein BGO39_03565 [Chloroflexi bacterium 54-19]|nr:MAG: hypothetical protein BGO39_03565 [Chloroflexi bacterium 54-19]